ncbi:MAG: T9SS type A sorting domain-containing protein [Calditrichaeota bacterium]|nr:T9SS type A sorting domain-containing protein [Calditrichota bacterium]
MCRIFVFIRFVSIFLLVFHFNPINSNASGSTDNNQTSKINLDLKSSTATEVQISFKLNDFQIQEVVANGEQFQKFIIENESSVSPEGWPDLPSIRRLVLIPPQSGVELKITGLLTHIVGDINVFPRQISIESDKNNTMNIDSDPDDLTLSAEAASCEGFWPREVASIGTPAIMRGYRMVSVVINPMRYNRQTRQLEVVDEIDIELDFGSEDNRVNPVERPRPNLHSQAVLDLVSDLVVNPPEPSRDMGIRNGSIVYVIKQWDEVEDALRPLIEWRRQMGWSVEVIRVNDDAQNEEIKAAIQEAYDEWDTPPEMVVICGDTDGPYSIACWDHRRGANVAYESDHDYVMLDGDDVLPDAAIGRFSFNGIAEGTRRLGDIVDKIISYESDPFIGEGDQVGWQKRAALFAGDQRSGFSCIDVCKWAKELMIRNDYDEFYERYWSEDDPRPDGQNWITDVFNNGISLYLYRGWANMNNFAASDVLDLQNERMLPFVILPTCNTGDFAQDPFSYAERFLQHSEGGGIGCVGMGGASHTAYNNLLAASVFRSIFGSKNPYQGWAAMAGKVELYQHYFDRGDIEHAENRGIESWLCALYIFNLIGDPATDLYTDVPKILNVEHPNDLRIGDTHYEVSVFDEEGEPLSGVRVCMYQVGEFQATDYTDDNGLVMFNFDPDLWIGGTGLLTVTGHNLMPYQEEFRVERALNFIGAGEFLVDDDAEGASNGDGDGIANPTERIELTVAIRNYGGDVPEGVVNLTLTPGLPNLEVVNGNAMLENAPAVGEVEEVEFVVDIGGGFPDEQLAIFYLECVVGESNWMSSVSLPLEGPELEFVSILWAGEPIRPNEISNLAIRIRNIGSKETGALNATLVSLTPTINVPISESSYVNIQAGAEEICDRLFRMSADMFHLGGSDADLALILTSEAGFVDTAFFSYTIDQAGAGQPFGPDDYGYICLDNTDVEWFSAPEYDWIEIDPHRRGEGTDTDLRDIAEEGDVSMLMDLPFGFQYYGQEFEEITICSNGWLAMGDCSELITARNRRFPAGMCAPGMIGPFWDDLLTSNDGGIYTLYDEELNIFIVEWSQMYRLGPREDDEASETFQCILYDPEFYRTTSGDGEIVFQYLDVEDARSCFNWDVPFASVGICSPDQGDGLTYSYWNELTAGAVPLEDGLAIKFTSSKLTTTGRISGTVSDIETGEPIEGATIRTLHGLVAVSNEGGIYEIEHAPAEIDFSLTASVQGYNDSTEVDLIIEDEGEIEINFALLHPEFDLSVDELQAEADIDQRIDLDFTLANAGNGQLVWRSEMQNIGGANAEPWELRGQINVGEIIGDSRVQGGIFVDDMYYLAGSNNRDPQIYVLDINGEIIDQYDQPGGGGGGYGYKDLAFDGELIWGSGSSIIYGFTPDGELVVEFEGPFNPNNNLAWDPDNELLWVSSTTSNLMGMNREGEMIAELDRGGLRNYGLAYWPFDPDGYNLYVFHKDSDVADQIITKVNTENNDMIQVRVLEPEGGGTPAGVFITNQFDVFSWVLLGMTNNGVRDRIDIWQLEVRREWAIVEPTEGVIDSEDSQEFILHLDASLLPPILAEGELHFFHNADDGHEVIPISLNITDDENNRDLDVQLAPGWNLISLNISPNRDMYTDFEALGPDVILMTEQLRIDEDNHQIVIFKDQQGRFYSPVFNFNNIPYWNLTEGYQVNVTEAAELHWRGEPIPPGADIPLRGDWNTVAYLPDYNLSARFPDLRAVSSIRDNLLMAKDALGRFLILGEVEFSNMPPWRAGQGYMLKVDAPDLTLNYPPPEEEVAFTPPCPPLLCKGKNTMLAESPVSQSGHWTSPTPTGENMSLLITNINGFDTKFGDQIGAFKCDGLLIGSGAVNTDGMCGLAIWGDDKSTEEVDGLQTGEVFTLKLWDAGAELELSVETIQQGAGLVYATDSFTMLDVSVQTAVPGEFYLSQVYPNPFNNATRINYGLPEAGHVLLKVCDISGRVVSTLIDMPVTAGHHSTKLNAGQWSSGLYLLQFEASNYSATRKVLLVK